MMIKMAMSSVKALGVTFRRFAQPQIARSNVSMQNERVKTPRRSFGGFHSGSGSDFRWKRSGLSGAELDAFGFEDEDEDDGEGNGVDDDDEAPISSFADDGSCPLPPPPLSTNPSFTGLALETLPPPLPSPSPLPSSLLLAASSTRPLPSTEVHGSFRKKISCEN